MLLGNLGHRTFVCLAQDRDHLRFSESTLSHDFLSSRKPFSQVLRGPKIPGQVSAAEMQEPIINFSVVFFEKYRLPRLDLFTKNKILMRQAKLPSIGQIVLDQKIIR